MATSVWTKVNDTTISLDDPDVQAVFSSLTIKQAFKPVKL